MRADSIGGFVYQMINGEGVEIYSANESTTETTESEKATEIKEEYSEYAYKQWLNQLLDENGVGDITTFTHETHRRPDEASGSSGDAFRAWMRERLTTAFDVADAANSGRVHATPEEYVCTWCRVKEACGLAPIVGGDSTWN